MIDYVWSTREREVSIRTTRFLNGIINCDGKTVVRSGLVYVKFEMLVIQEEMLSRKVIRFTVFRRVLIVGKANVDVL